MVGKGPNAVQSVTIEKLRQFYTDLKCAHWKVRQIKKHFVFIDSMVWTCPNCCAKCYNWKTKKFYTDLKCAHWKVRQIKKLFLFKK